MMAEDVVQLEKWKAHFVHQNKIHIEELFGIRINLSDISGNDDCQFSLAPRNSTLCVVSSESTLDSVYQAKEFIQSVTSEENTKQTYCRKCSDEEISLLLQEKSNIEKSSEVKINFDYSSKVVEIIGSIQNIVHAKSSIENMVRELDLTSKIHLDSGDMKILHSDCKFVPKPYLVIGDKAKLKSITRSCSLADDLSLQTDFCQPVKTHQGLGTNIDINSYDGSVSPGCHTPELRSVSPQELHYQANDNENIQSSVGQLRISSPALSRSSESVASLVEENIGGTFIPQKVPDYESKVEFALKLGYTENQLIRALENLGPCGDNQNELLSELIKVASTPKGSNNINGASDFDTYNSDSVSDTGEEETNFTLSDRVKADPSSNLRTIVIDGSNVAMSHGNKEIFSCKGIQLAVDWFRSRGHKDITVFVPQWRKETSRSDARIKDQDILNQLEREKVLVFTPARRIGGRRVVCYDDRYVLKLAAETNGIIVSNDNYRDLTNENPEFKKVVEERLLMYSFVNDRFMPPDDPLGRNGPSLDNFLQKEPTLPEPLPPLCPYGSKKCTYGNKCKYYHPERRNQPQKTVTEKLAEQARQNLQERERVKATASEGEKKKITRTKTPLGRTQSVNPDQSLSDASVSAIKSPRQESPSLEDPLNRSGEEEQVLKWDTKEKDERYIEFNQRLDEQRRKLEIPLKKEDQREKQDLSMSQWSFGKANEKTRCLSASTSLPVQQYDIKEKFLSGHLLLAKKLSDEATESQIWKQCGESGDHSPRGQQVYGSTQGTSPTASPQKGQNKPRAIVKQKLCRQYSLQGQEDPRLHKQLQGQNSCDPRFLSSNVVTVASTNCDNYNSSSLQADFMRGQQQQERISCCPRSSTDSSRLNTFCSQNMHELQYPHQILSDTPFQSKAAIARMQSAPVTHATFHQPQQQTPTQHRPFSQMIRQNSTSDPQLHKNDDDGHPPLSQLAPRQSLPIHDSSGNITFQISGRPSQPVSYNNYSPSSAFPQPSYHHPPPLNPQYSAQYQQGIDYGFSYHAPSGMMHTGLHSNQPFCCTSSPSSQPSLTSGDSAVKFGNMLQSRSGSLWNNTRTVSYPVSRSSPHQGFAVKTPVPISDPRCDLYYKLCNIFPEQKVREVMNSHPEAEDINEICAYIIGAKK
ncbi:hypothetical protein CHS0354_018746 [Potamilus streckersoni]|uniref:C3H1-type domain-containing protein n=1 Tax=Potamilus streckersoni TaxID=2493646 RepID=A0AAE0T3V7_9BIVA|nr:hypothetical protein CHS0354_018746 [Potamilus streckersoni]